MIAVHLFAFFVFITSYLIALQFMLAGQASGEAFMWALAFGFVSAIPALAFWLVTFVLFHFLRWGATVLLAVVTIAIPIYFGTAVAPGKVAFFQAMVVAAIAHQLILLLGAQAAKTQWPPLPV